MGEIIIKVPGSVRKVFEIDLPSSAVCEKIEELKRQERIERMIKFLESHKNSVEIEECSEEELHLQGD